jgi:fructokinase
MESPRIVSFGEVLWDLFPDGERFGGAPAFTIHENSAWDRITWTDEFESRVKEADAVYFGTLAQRSSLSRRTIRRGIRAARDAGVPSILDINLRSPYFDSALIRESIDLSSILKLSEDELQPVAGACGIDSVKGPAGTLRGLLVQFHLDAAVMTQGAKGALLVSPTETIDQPGLLTTVHDTVGAGDAFAAVLAAGLLRGESLPRIIRNACEVAASVCAQPGAVPECPSVNETGTPTNATEATSSH